MHMLLTPRNSCGHFFLAVSFHVVQNKLSKRGTSHSLTLVYHDTCISLSSFVNYSYNKSLPFTIHLHVNFLRTTAFLLFAFHRLWMRSSLARVTSSSALILNRYVNIITRLNCLV